jgi:uncharacterized protein (DUF2141 family)
MAAIAGVIAVLCAGGHAARADDKPAGCGAIGPGQGALHISISGMRNTKGIIEITIYPDEPAHFLDGKYKVAQQHLPITLPVTTACFVLPAPAVYGVAMMHDENSNGVFDLNALGIPVEGYGFSNNPTLYFGPPNLSRVRFTLRPGDNSVDIRMKYY